MLGGSLDCRASGTLVVNCSFWIGSTLRVTLGLAAWKPSAACCHTPLSGSEVPLCHHVSVTGPSVFLVADPLLLQLSSPPHATTPPASAAQASKANAPRARMLRMSIHSSSWMTDGVSVTQLSQLCQSLSITF